MSEAKSWPASSIEVADLEELVPYAENSRQHPERQLEQIEALMLEFGWTNPVLRDEDRTILAGHGRVMAAKRLVARGFAQFGKIPTMVARGWSDAQKRAYVIADNKVTENAGWNSALLGSELKAISAAGFDMGMLGFSAAELRSAMRGPGGGLTNPDAAPPLEAVAVSLRGDTWILGDHRLRCGSSTNAADVQALLSGHRPMVMVTDPPYGVNYDPTWRARATGQKVRATGKVLNDDRADWREAWALFPGAVAYVWHGGLHSGTVQRSLEAEGFEMRAQVIWAKDRFALSRGHYHWRHEPCWYAVRQGMSAAWRGGRKRDTIWRVPGLESEIEAMAVEILQENGAETTLWEIPMTVDDGATGHGTQKPVECMRRPIEAHTVEGDLVYEPFSGSGSTIIAGEQTARRVLAMELSPAYVDVAVRRWQAFTGRAAVLEGSGQTFEQVAGDRTAEDLDPDGAAWA